MTHRSRIHWITSLSHVWSDVSNHIKRKIACYETLPFRRYLDNGKVNVSRILTLGTTQIQQVQQECPDYNSIRKCVLQNIFKSHYFKKCFASFMMSIAEIVLRLHFVAFLCIMTTSDIRIIDFVSQVIITISCELHSDFFFSYCIMPLRPQFRSLSSYLVNTYSLKNFKRWKRNGVIIVSTYVFVLMYCVQINNTFILLCTIQNVVICLCNETLDNKDWIKKQMKKKIDELKPEVTTVYCEMKVIENFYQNPQNSHIRNDGYIIVPYMQPST